MTKRVQILRYTDAATSAFVGRVGELSVNLTNKSLVVHDGINAGGQEQARVDFVNVDGVPALTQLSAGVGSIAGLTVGANRLLYTESSDSYTSTSLTLLGRNLLAGNNTAAMRATLETPGLAVSNTFLNQHNEFRGRIEMNNHGVTPASFVHHDDNADVDKKRWGITTSGTANGDLHFQARSDDDITRVDYMVCTRGTGVSVFRVNLLAGEVQANGSNIVTEARNNNFAGQQRITNTAPTLFLHETGVAADSGKYYFQVDSTNLTLFLMNDAENASTPVMQFARTGINSDAIDFTADNFRINGESVATQSPAVPGYVKGKAVYVSATGDNGLGINIASSAVMDAWESYGPTGSGASNIMADLDVLPAGATWVELSIRLLIRRISAPDTLVAVYARPTGSTANGILTSVVLHEAQTDAGEINVYFLHRSIKVALDAQNRFELKWDIPASGTVLSQGIIAIVTGFGA